MTVHVISTVFRESRAEQGARLTLIAIADDAHDDGVAWTGEAVLAAKTNLSVETVRRSIRKLESLGELAVFKAQRGRRRINVYRVRVGAVGLGEIDVDRHPAEIVEALTTGHIDRSSSPDDRASDPSTTGHLVVEPEVLTMPLTETPLEPPVETGAGLVEVGRMPGRGFRTAVAIGKVDRKAVTADEGYLADQIGKVDRKAVTADEGYLADQILEEWNRQTGQELSAVGWLRKIVMRLREHPDAGLDAHAAVMRENLARPWWKGPASPSVIYGSDEQFERSILVAANAASGETAGAKPMRYGRGMTTEAILDLGRRMAS